MPDIVPCRTKWKGTLTDRERFRRVMHHQPADRCVNIEFGYWDENFKQWPLFADNGVAGNGQANVFFNFDIMRTTGGNDWMNPEFETAVVSETATTQVVRNAEGLLAEVPKDGHSTIPHFVGSSIRTPEDWKRCKEERFRLDDPSRRIDAAQVRKAHPSGRDYPLGVWTGSMIGRIRSMLTIEGLAYAVCDHPDMVEDMVETCCRLVEHSLDQLLPHVDFDYACGWEDISCNTGPLVSMDFFRNVIVPRYARIGRKLRAAGVDIWWTDSDGDVRAFIPHWLECGLNTLFPFEVNGCGHPARILERYGKDLRIVGGVDKMTLIRGREATKAYLESLVPLVEKGGFIPHVDHRCPPDVRPDDYLYYLDLKERLFGMK